MCSKVILLVFEKKSIGKNTDFTWNTGSAEDKIKLLFSMYDVDKSGKISKEEGTGMIKFVWVFNFESILKPLNKV